MVNIELNLTSWRTLCFTYTENHGSRTGNIIVNQSQTDLFRMELLYFMKGHGESNRLYK